jgi:enamine deaminase RidA (YjgF/YER057c/UK114 family)
MRIEKRLEELGLVLPQFAKVPPGLKIQFAWVRLYGDRAYVSGHGPLSPDGTPAGPFGQVGAEVSAEQAYTAARLTALAMLSSLRQALGDLDRISAWLMVSGMVSVAPGFAATTNVINGCSEVLLEVFGSDVGTHARTAIGVTHLPLNLPVIIAAEVAVR